ncbi:MAG: ribokinase, partial [Muribaculaceae bacterium]|nr:ribokinase [Muribaculaceae bacterium]
MDTLRKRIAVVGSINTDMVVKSSHIPRPGETVLGGSFMMNSGGKGANQAVAAARLGGDVCFIARVGNDALGERAVKLFREEGIDTSAISIDETHASGVALIMVDEKGENCISVASGANAALSPIEIEASAPIIENSALLLAQLETPVATVGRAARIARKAGATVVLNPAPACPLPESLLRDVDIIIPNETEASILSGIEVTDMESARKAAEKIVASGVAVVIITMGAAGALIYKDSHPIH